MPDLREEILWYLWEGYRDYKQGRRESCLPLDYLRDECARAFRIAVKRGYYQWLRAEGRDRAERAGELLLLVVDALLNDDRLKGKAGKCEPMCERGELAPLVALGLGADGDPWRPYKPSERARASATNKALLEAREALASGDDNLVLEDEALCALVFALLEGDVRNKNFGPLERLTETIEDLRAGDDAVCVANPGDDRDQILSALKKMSAALCVRVGLAAKSGLASWWDSAAEGNAEELQRAVDCLLLGRAEQFLGNAGLSAPEGPKPEGEELDADARPGDSEPTRLVPRTRDVPVRLVDRYLREQGKLSRGALPLASECLGLFDAMASSPDDDAYDNALVPLAIDSKTGGGIFAMGCEQVGRFVEQGSKEADLFPVTAVAPVLVDYRLAQASAQTGTSAHVRASEFVVARPVTVRPHVIAPLGLKGADEYVPALWRFALDGLRKSFERACEPPKPSSVREGSFWTSYRGAGISVPDGCPEAFRAYFAPSEVEVQAFRLRPLSLDDFGEDLQDSDQVVVPWRLVEYFESEGQFVGEVRDEVAVRAGKALVSHEEARAYMLRYRAWDKWHVLGEAYVVANGRRSQKVWDEVVRVGLDNASFLRWCVEDDRARTTRSWRPGSRSSGSHSSQPRSSQREGGQ